MKKLVGLICIVLILFSCKKDEEIVETPDCDPTVQDYMPMKVGNYWVYQEFKIDSNGFETQVGSEDSVIITSIKQQNGNEYFVFENTNGLPYPQLEGPRIQMLRDSSGYLVNLEGTILMSVVNFTDVLDRGNFPNNEHLFGIYINKMEKEKSIHIANGLVQAINYQVSREFYKPYSDELGTDPILSNNYYAKGIGKVKDDYYYLTPYVRSKTIMERRLVRYFVQK